jgi:hypothetical protein
MAEALGRDHPAPLHQMLGRTTKPGQAHFVIPVGERNVPLPATAKAC